ncbi:ATP-binding protein [Desulfobotulus pelophilus]|uniref:ATP-binding protein n=1 Tax=Desulfobotulus pelophilus TaxID=2823377 RepID=UPI0026E52277|nr:ATP-binding protein [Desulfobotulus pelophilus]
MAAMIPIPFLQSRTARILAEAASKARIAILLAQTDPSDKGRILYLNSHMEKLCESSGEYLMANHRMNDLLCQNNTGQRILRTPSGKNIPVDVVTCTIPIETPPPLLYYIRDISEQLHTERQLKGYSENLERMVRQHTRKLSTTLESLKETQSQLIQSEKMASLGQLAAGVAHEINNPLGFVKSNLGTIRDYFEDLFEVIDAAEILENNLTSEDARKRAMDTLTRIRTRIDLDFIREDHRAVISESLEGMERVARIVADLKNFSRTESPDAESTDIQECLESTLHIVWNEIKYKAEVIRDFEPLPRVLSSPQKLAQVFMNLLVNAAQSIEKQGTIHLQTRILENSIIVAITDTGSGIPDHILPKIFDPFFTTKPVGKGTGLGLNISYNIMQQLGGDIDVDTTPGEGSTFRVHIPLREP